MKTRDALTSLLVSWSVRPAVAEAVSRALDGLESSGMTADTLFSLWSSSVGRIAEEAYSTGLVDGRDEVDGQMRLWKAPDPFVDVYRSAEH